MPRYCWQKLDRNEYRFIPAAPKYFCGRQICAAARRRAFCRTLLPISAIDWLRQAIDSQRTQRGDTPGSPRRTRCLQQGPPVPGCFFSNSPLPTFLARARSCQFAASGASIAARGLECESRISRLLHDLVRIEGYERGIGGGRRSGTQGLSWGNLGNRPLVPCRGTGGIADRRSGTSRHPPDAPVSTVGRHPSSLATVRYAG
jgi:hypothetical protein